MFRRGTQRTSRQTDNRYQEGVGRDCRRVEVVGPFSEGFVAHGGNCTAKTRRLSVVEGESLTS